MKTTPGEVLAFWFGEPARDMASLAIKLKRWFTGGPALDEEIRVRFAPAVDDALRGAYDDWARTIQGRLALILLLDQFTRSIFRDTPRAFAGDAKASRLTVDALDAKLDQGLSSEERAFLILPLAHAEDRAMQERSVVEATRLVEEAPEWQRPIWSMSVEQSRKYLEVISRFGRFPHRNAALGRASTPEEEAFLVGWEERRRPSTFDEVTR